MGKLADIVREQRAPVKPAITFNSVPDRERKEVFTSEGFKGFSDFFSDEPKEEFQEFQQQKKMSHFFSIIQALLKMMD